MPAVLSSDAGGSNTVVLNCNNVALTSTATVFYIAIPAATYSDLKIELSDDGSNYWTSMTATSNITIQRNKIYTITYQDGTYTFKKGAYVSTNGGTTSSTVGACINTGLQAESNAETNTWTCEAKFKYNHLHESCLLGCNKVSSSTSSLRFYFFSLGSSTTKYNVGYGRNGWFSVDKTSSINTTNIYTITSVNGRGNQSCSVKINDGSASSWWTGTETGNVSTRKLYMFATNATDGVAKYMNCNCYYLNIKKNGTYVRRYIPAKNSSNVAGMYDIVNHQFYATNSTVAFTFH